MPSKRSKSKEREKKQRQRAALSTEAKDKERENLKKRMKKIRENKNPAHKKMTHRNSLWPPGLKYGETPLYEMEKELQRERMKKKRESQTQEEKEVENAEARERMKRKRESQTQEEKEVENAEARERMNKIRREQNEEKKSQEKEKNKARMAKWRENQTKELNEYEKISRKHERRAARKKRTGKEHLQENLKAKKGMQLIYDEGWKKEFCVRSGGKTEEIRDWEVYRGSGRINSQVLEAKRPDIIQILNEKRRVEKERERNRIEREKNGEWCYHAESGEYFWSGTGDPEYGDTFCFEAPTPEELKKLREDEEKISKAMLEEKKRLQKEKRKKIQKEQKEAMDKPLDPIPEKELCEYEKLRNRNIKEIEEAMAANNFFEDLREYKKEIGFRIQKTKQIPKNATNISGEKAK